MLSPATQLASYNSGHGEAYNCDWMTASYKRCRRHGNECMGPQDDEIITPVRADIDDASPSSIHVHLLLPSQLAVQLKIHVYSDVQRIVYYFCVYTLILGALAILGSFGWSHFYFACGTPSQFSVLLPATTLSAWPRACRGRRAMKCLCPRWSIDTA